jgi:putative chitinase
MGLPAAIAPTVDVLVRCGVAPTPARLFTEPLTRACAARQITTPVRLAAFVAQCIVESAGFTRLEENLYYTTPERIRQIFPRTVPNLQVAATLCRKPQALANRVYANKGGNGNEASGDGWKYRGRGLFQLSMRDNYVNAANDTGRPYLTQPELVGLPEDACLTAAWYWNHVKANVLADSSQIDAITRAINGPGMVDADKRRSLFDDAVRALA